MMQRGVVFTLMTPRNNETIFSGKNITDEAEV